MADPRLFGIHELDPQVAESASATPGGTATLQLLHRPTEAYQLDVHGFACGPVSVEEACTDQVRMRLPSGDADCVISVPVRGAVLAMYRGKELDFRPGQAVVFQPPSRCRIRCWAGCCKRSTTRTGKRWTDPSGPGDHAQCAAASTRSRLSRSGR